VIGTRQLGTNRSPGSRARPAIVDRPRAVGNDSRGLSVDRRAVLRADAPRFILNELRLRSDLLELIPLDIAGRWPAPSPANQDRR
jgi:hypothetical protein